MVRNIYESKYYLYYAILPIAFLLVSILFIGKIPLDSSLKGGIQVQLQTNGSINIGNLTSMINSHIPYAEASISKAPSGITVTLAANTSITKAENILAQILTLAGNYSSYETNLSIMQSMPASAKNATIYKAIANINSSMKSIPPEMSSALKTELALLSHFLNTTYSYNSSNPENMSNVASAAYSNALANYEKGIVGVLSKLVPFKTYSYSYVTPTMGSYFLAQMRDIIIAAFIVVAIAVFFIFRTPVPSLAVVFGSANDILIALGFMGIFHVPLGIASIGGLLMLVGYSIDTDTLTAIRVLKRHEGTPEERAFHSMSTGITMTTTAIITFSVLFIVSYFFYVQTYQEIASVVLFGLVGDLLATWLANTPIILWYKKKKEH
ncbi:MAG: hypothetical protein ACP5RP_03660 [Candidatus Micrarchaeia archaeon]